MTGLCFFFFFYFFFFIYILYFHLVLIVFVVGYRHFWPMELRQDTRRALGVCWLVQCHRGEQHWQKEVNVNQEWEVVGSWQCKNTSFSTESSGSAHRSLHCSRRTATHFRSHTQHCKMYVHLKQYDHPVQYVYHVQYFHYVQHAHPVQYVHSVQYIHPVQNVKPVAVYCISEVLYVANQLSVSWRPQGSNQEDSLFQFGQCSNFLDSPPSNPKYC